MIPRSNDPKQPRTTGGTISGRDEPKQGMDRHEITPRIDERALVPVLGISVPARLQHLRHDHHMVPDLDTLFRQAHALHPPHPALAGFQAARPRHQIADIDRLSSRVARDFGERFGRTGVVEARGGEVAVGGMDRVVGRGW